MAGGTWEAQKVVPLAMNLSQSDCHSENDPDAGRVWEVPNSSHEAAAWDASQPEAALITSGKADENCINADNMGDATHQCGSLSLLGSRAYLPLEPRPHSTCLQQRDYLLSAREHMI